jgi:magnesium transporter
MMALKVFEKITQNFQEYLKEINQRRNALEQKLYDANRNEELLQLMRIQKSLVYFVTALRSNELLMMKLARTNFLGLTEDEKDFLDDLVIETSQALETAQTYTNILSSTLDAFASIISNNQNEVLKRLSTLTILLSIPVLIASIYGMNVSLPFQHSPMAFWLPVSISLLILAFALYNFVRHNKR